MQNLLAAVDSERLVRDRRHLHAHAETGFDLTETFAYVQQALTQMGLSPRRCGRCGLVADIGHGEKCVLLRADMDALPIREETGLPFACPSGRMHACGHDLHTAMLLEAARVLKQREDGLNGTVRLMFQPAEEIFCGAADMLADGLLDAPRPTAAFMLHVMTNVALPVGTVIVSAPGISAPAAGLFEIGIQGRGCHGAMPHTGVDPISIAAHTVLNLQQLQARELSLSQPCALTIGAFQAGDAANVIPDQAILRGSMRTFDDDTRQFLTRRVEEVAVQTAAMFHGQATVRSLGGCPTLRNDGDLSAAVLSALRTLLGADRALSSSELGGDAAKSSGSEDFANISHEVPSLMVALAAGQPDDGHNHPVHHPMTTFDESALSTGAAVYAAMALTALK